MKIENEFMPVILTFESQEEIDYLYALINHITIYDLHSIFQDLQKKLSKYRSVDYEKIHDVIDKKIGG